MNISKHLHRRLKDRYYSGKNYYRILHNYNHKARSGKEQYFRYDATTTTQNHIIIRYKHKTFLGFST